MVFTSIKPTHVLTLLAILFTTPALARHHRHHHHPFRESTSKYHHHARHHGVRYAHHGSGSGVGRPHAWCGWFARHLVGHDPGPEFNLARNWVRWGNNTIARIGAIVVWPHHVGKIVGGFPGRWEVLSGNDGHRVRTRVRSVAGAIAFRD
jgi:hypothetical protein